MPKQMEVPSFSSPAGGKKFYRRFSGVDFSNDETQIEDGRSPDALNIISDEGGFPERRVGWRTLHRFGGTVYGIFPYEGELKTAAAGETLGKFVIHTGDKILLYDADSESETILRQGVTAGVRTQGFYFNGKLYLLTGTEYLVFDGKAVTPVREQAYIPTTTYGAKPAGGGTAYEKANLLSNRRKNKFTADGTSTEFVVDSKKMDETGEIKVSVGGADRPDGWTADRAAGKIIFTQPPEKPANEGTDNVTIEFPYTSTTQGPEDVEKCAIFALYGLNSENRVFLAGNPDAPNKELWSGLSDPTYFPDNNFALVGSTDFPIMCFVKNQGELVIVKADNRQEGTIWHQTAEALSDGTASFPIRSGLSGYGAAARYSAASLNDDPLYLSPRGVYAPTMTYSYTLIQRQLLLRSKRVNTRLTKQKGLADAVAACWRGWYLLCMDGVAYVADGNQKKSENGYEWYFWDNMPVYSLCAHEQTLYFGTKDGRFCKFNDDFVDEDNNILMRAYNDDGAAIICRWTTKLDSMDTPMRLKTMPKRGSGVHLKAYTRSTVEICLRTEDDHGKQIKSVYADRLDFNDISFERFTFSTVLNNAIPFNTKKKKWKMIQVQLRSSAVNEGFGVHSIVLRYLFAGYAKR